MHPTAISVVIFELYSKTVAKLSGMLSFRLFDHNLICSSKAPTLQFCQVMLISHQLLR